MKKRKILMIALFVWTAGAGLAFSPSVYAFEKGYGHRGGKDLTLGFFMKSHFLLEEQQTLGISDEQANAIRQLKVDVKKEVIRKSAEIDILELEIKEKLYESKIDVAAIQKLIDQKYEIKKALAKTVVEAYAKLKSTLNEKQWQDMKNLKKERMQKHFAKPWQNP